LLDNEFSKGTNRCKNCTKEYNHNNYLKNQDEIRKHTSERSKNDNRDLGIDDTEQKCIRCYKIKDITEYCNRKANKNGHKHVCKQCQSEEGEIYRSKDGIKTKIKNRRKQYRKDNKEKLRIDGIKYREENKEILRVKHTTRSRVRRNNDPVFKIKSALRHRVHESIKHEYKSDHTMNLVGCDINFLIVWFNIQAFARGYKNFDARNYDGKKFHIDHKVPCKLFNLKCGYHQRLCFNWSNMEMLSVEDHREKTRLENSN
jgi:hypothetical protein